MANSGLEMTPSEETPPDFSMPSKADLRISVAASSVNMRSKYMVCVFYRKTCYRLMYVGDWTGTTCELPKLQNRGGTPVSTLSLPPVLQPTQPLALQKGGLSKTTFLELYYSCYSTGIDMFRCDFLFHHLLSIELAIRRRVTRLLGTITGDITSSKICLRRAHRPIVSNLSHHP